MCDCAYATITAYHAITYVFFNMLLTKGWGYAEALYKEFFLIISLQSKKYL